MSNSFKSRVFGCVIIKSINANYNADFSHQPRTLPDGTVYATDKALKYTIRNYLAKNHPESKVFYFKSYSEEMQPRSLKENYVNVFGEFPKPDKKDSSKARKIVLGNLLQCIDVRLFGGTFAEEGANLSIHGTAQFTHGVNRFPEGVIYSEQISSPFRNSNEKSSDSMQTTLGTQFKLKEGHYVHHFSINPRNLEELSRAAGHDGLSEDDIEKLKEALRNGATFYDSSAKAGVENELLFWVQLKEGSKLVLPSLVDLISVNESREIDFSKVTALLEKENVKPEIEKIEVYFNAAATTVVNLPAPATKIELN